jgi:hypothetical protein
MHIRDLLRTSHKPHVTQEALVISVFVNYNLVYIYISFVLTADLGFSGYYTIPHNGVHMLLLQYYS